MTKTISKSDRSNWIELIVAVAICQAAGLVGLLVCGSVGNSPWYRRLKRPGFTPPGKVIGPICGVLYTLMGFALQQLWQRRGEREGQAALRLFGAQWLLSALWTPVFFRRRSISGALAIMIGLWTASTATLFRALRVSFSATILLIPSWIWIGFATVLNLGILALNPVQHRPISLARASIWLEARQRRR
jgi:tryptophan-rich sensory protein